MDVNFLLRGLFNIHSIIIHQVLQNMLKDIHWHNNEVNSHDRQHKIFVLWFTGLSGAGKSTLGNAIEKNHLMLITLSLF